MVGPVSKSIELAEVISIPSKRSNSLGVLGSMGSGASNVMLLVEVGGVFVTGAAAARDVAGAARVMFVAAAGATGADRVGIR